MPVVIRDSRGGRACCTASRDTNRLDGYGYELEFISQFHGYTYLYVCKVGVKSPVKLEAVRLLRFDETPFNPHIATMIQNPLNKIITEQLRRYTDII